MQTAAARIDRELQMMEAMVDCAYALGLAVGEAAKAEADTKRSIELYDLFHKSFLAVRMGIRLSLALRAGPKPARPVVEAPEDDLEIERPERPERADPVEREREREHEAVSLPRFLSTLGLVARDAGRVGGLPAVVRDRELPALRALLADSDPALAPGRPAQGRPAPGSAGVALLSRPAPAPTPPGRSALLRSTAAATRSASAVKPPGSGSG